MTDSSVMYKIREVTTFLDDVNSFVGWQIIEKLLHRCLGKRRDASGKILYLAVKMFKVILLQFWYNLSDREMMEALFDRISFRKFAGFSFEYTTPSYSTICRFRKDLIKANLDVIFFNLLNQIFGIGRTYNKRGNYCRLLCYLLFQEA